MGTGVAVTKDAPPRIFVNYPRLSDDVAMSVAEVLLPSGEVRAYPDAAWNDYVDSRKPPQDKFVCVQSVHADAAGTLWILDPANPKFAGVVSGEGQS